MFNDETFGDEGWDDPSSGAEGGRAEEERRRRGEGVGLPLRHSGGWS